MTVPYQQVLSRGASPFMRWSLSPFLLLFAAIFFMPLSDAIEEHRMIGVLATSLVIILCISGLLALWGVPFVGRIASGIIAGTFGWYLIDQCFINFNGTWGWGRPKSEPTPINSILGFLVFGLPCLIYTFSGRFTVRKEAELEGDFEDYEDDENDEPTESRRGDIGASDGDKRSI